MKDYSELQRNFATMNAKIKDLCRNVSSKAAHYKGVTMPRMQAQ